MGMLDDLRNELDSLRARVELLESEADETGDDFPEWDGGVASGQSSGFELDYCIVGIRKVTIPERTSNFLKIYFDGTTPPEWVGAMPETQDENAIVIDVRKVRIYLPGNYA